VRRFVTAEVRLGEIRAKCDSRGVALPAHAFEIKEEERTVGWEVHVDEVESDEWARKCALTRGLSPRLSHKIPVTFSKTGFQR
jgi:hypothetical protein